ncbi:hypothetical protein [Natronorubrum halophilum]|nr:hypothetical protein [Natronorubrum halophilum]
MSEKETERYTITIGDILEFHNIEAKSIEESEVTANGVLAVDYVPEDES